jgi:hypothetical protein
MNNISRFRGSGFAAGLLVLMACALAIPAHAAENEDPVVDEEFVRGEPDIGGYIQYHFNHPFGGAENRFRVQRARLSVEGQLNKKISYEMDIDPRAPNHAGTLRDAFFNVELRPGYTLRLGQHKTKFGYINNRSSSRLYVVNRPEMADAVSRGINLRDIGASLIINRPMGGGRTAEYWLSVVNGAGMNAQRDNNKAKNVFGRVGMKRRGSGLEWRVGASGGIGDIFSSSTKPEFAADGGFWLDFKRAGADLQLDGDRFHMATEFVFGNHKEKGLTENIYGYYATLVGKTSGNWGPLVSYDSMNHTEDVRLTVGGYHGKPNSDFRFLLNYEVRGAIDIGRLYLWTLVRI